MEQTTFIFQLSEHEKQLLDDSARILQKTKSEYLRDVIRNMAIQLGIDEPIAEGVKNEPINA